VAKTRDESSNIAAIDIGSNGIRLVIASILGERQIVPIKVLRARVRIGKDTFSSGRISPETAKRVLKAFTKFRKLLRKYKVSQYRAVATSAVREALNQKAFLEYIFRQSGIKPLVIDGKEEGRLIFEAISNHVDLRHEQAVLIDIGGGSVEVTVAINGVIKAIKSLPLGTVRLLSSVPVDSPQAIQLRIQKFFQKFDSALKILFRKFLNRNRPLLVIGSGGNMEALLKLRQTLLKKNSSTVLSLSELDAIISRLKRFTVQERVEIFKLRPDRADVIIPASLTVRELLTRLRADRILIPCVGLKEGVLLDLARDLNAKREPRKHILWSLFS
jgi:exopolyphosphatase / guanosine-5'-triphosphate,3'-diphosphate pyrophosphatase